METYRIQRSIQNVTIPIHASQAQSPADSLNGILCGIVVNAPAITGSSYKVYILGSRGETLFSKDTLTPNAVTAIMVDANNYPLQIPLSLNSVSAVQIKDNGDPAATATLTFTNTGPILANETVTVGNVVYKFVTSLTGAANEILITADIAAAGTLTSNNTNVSNNDTVTIGGVVYTFKTNLTEAKATGVLTSNNTNVSDNDTVTIGARTYRFKTSIAQINDINIGANADASLTNLANAINAAGTPGTDYFTGTTINTDVSSSAVASHALTLTDKAVGTAGNSVATTKVAATLSWGNTTLTGGVNSIANEIKIGADADTSLANFQKCINHSATAGTNYSTASVVDTNVSCGNVISHAVILTALVAGTSGNSITFAKSAATLSVDAATLGTTTAGAWSGDTTLAHLVSAINASAGAGSTYGTGTVANPYVTAGSVTSHATTLSSVAGVNQGSDVATTTTSANLSFSTATLTGGEEGSSRTYNVDLLIQH